MPDVLNSSDLIRIIEIQNEIARASLDFEGVIRLVVRRAAEVTGAAGGVVEIVEGSEMVYRAVSGTAEGSLGLRLRRETSLSGLCVLRGIPLRCDDAETDPRVDREACRRVGVTSMICVPLVHAGTAVGALKVISPEREAFGDVDLVLLGLMSEIVASSMSHAEAFERHRHDGSHDPLTGLPNRRAFDEAAREERSRALRSHAPLSLVLFDLDRFKEINDRFGHPAGDIALRRFSEILEGTKRLPDRAFRLGGDEFALLLPSTGPDEARAAIERLRDAVAAAELGEGLIGVSAGAADAAGLEPEEAYARADAALLADKTLRKAAAG